MNSDDQQFPVAPRALTSRHADGVLTLQFHDTLFSISGAEH